MTVAAPTGEPLLAGYLNYPRGLSAHLDRFGGHQQPQR